MRHWLCWVALGCALLCYGQRVLEDVRWLTYPVAILITLGVGLGTMIGLVVLFTRIGWLPE